MVNCKTHLKFTHNKQKYELYGGQNRINSIDYLYILFTPEKKEITVVIENQNTKKTEETEAMLDLPTKVSQKIRKFLYIDRYNLIK